MGTQMLDDHVARLPTSQPDLAVAGHLLASSHRQQILELLATVPATSHSHNITLALQASRHAARRGP
jgi:hypothetical protein